MHHIEFTPSVKQMDEDDGNKSQNYVDRCRFKDIFNNHSNIIRDLANKGLIKSIDNIKLYLMGKSHLMIVMGH